MKSTTELDPQADGREDVARVIGGSCLLGEWSTEADGHLEETPRYTRPPDRQCLDSIEFSPRSFAAHFTI